MTYYIRMAVTHWSNIELQGAAPFPIRADMLSPDGSIGYLPVYESREAFEAAFPGEKPVIVQTVEQEQVSA